MISACAAFISSSEYPLWEVAQLSIKMVTSSFKYEATTLVPVALTSLLSLIHWLAKVPAASPFSYQTQPVTAPDKPRSGQLPSAFGGVSH